MLAAERGAAANTLAAYRRAWGEAGHAGEEPTAEELDIIRVRAKSEDVEAIARIGPAHGFRSFKPPEKGSQASRTRRLKAWAPKRHA